MIVDYKPSPKHLPTDREAMLYSVQLTTLGIDARGHMQNLILDGYLKVVNKTTPMQWCSDCADYHDFTHFDKMITRKLGISRICKRAKSRRRRIKEHSMVEFISDRGCKNENEFFKSNISENNKKILNIG